MIRQQKETVGLNKGGNPNLQPVDSNDQLPTLKEVGISKDLSSRSQQIASIPEEEFEETLDNHRQEQKAVTARTMEALAKKGKEHQQKEDNDETLEEALEPSEAMLFARMAISQLERIREEDPKKAKALRKVMKPD